MIFNGLEAPIGGVQASRLTTKKGLVSGSPWCVPFKEWMKNGG
jgi:hypothetical protein